MRVILLLALLLGAALRIGALGRDVRLHPDEALYATYARRMALDADLLLRDAPLDKPPLGLMLTALSFSLWNPGEFAARLPTVFASILSLAALAALACRLFGARVAVLAALLLALSPFDLAFAATGFHDPPLTLFLLLTCLAAASDRWTAAGVFAACAIATKQSSVQFLPVFLAVGLGAAACADWRGRDYARRLVRFAVPVVAVAL
ncbi:MAG: glycosyltransferase family 39 protein, partial [Anaerolineae bacterium]|nr:glycosyltransferase family 39 protein [Anaerolineae bacterium]